MGPAETKEPTTQELLKSFSQMTQQIKELKEQIRSMKKDYPDWSEKMTTKQAIRYINVFHKIPCARTKFDEYWKVYGYFPVRKFEADKNGNYFLRSEIDAYFNSPFLKLYNEL